MAEQLPFSRLRYNVDKKRQQIATHQAELVDMERELQLRCEHHDVVRYSETKPGDFYTRETTVHFIKCNTCGLTRPIQSA